MTYEDFKELALNPPRRNEDTVFEVTMRKIVPLPENRRNHYPKFPVTDRCIGFSSTLSGAERLVKIAVAKAEQERQETFNRFDVYESEIYCFHIKEYPLDTLDERGCYNYGVSWRLYDQNGDPIDHAWCSSMERDFGTKSGKFRGRPEESIRFKAGDIVEVYDTRRKCIKLAVATQSPINVDWCWRYRGCCLDGLPDNKEPEDGDEWFYGLDFSDDQAAVIDGPGYEYHEHIQTLDIMPLRFPLSEKLRKRYEGFWKACQEQNK